jgi:hypothetical protein
LRGGRRRAVLDIQASLYNRKCNRKYNRKY